MDKKINLENVISSLMNNDKLVFKSTYLNQKIEYWKDDGVFAIIDDDFTFVIDSDEWILDEDNK